MTIQMREGQPAVLDKPVYRAIQELRTQRDQIDQALRILEGLSIGKRRRGRPPKFLSELKKANNTPSTKNRKRAAKH